MPVTFTQIANNTASVTFAVGDDPDATVTIVYYPGLITEKLFAQLQSFAAMEGTNEVGEVIDGFDKLNKLLCRLMKSWDAYEDDAQTVMIPITPDRFSDLPIPFRLEILNAIIRNMRPEAKASQIQSSGN